MQYHVEKERGADEENGVYETYALVCGAWRLNDVSTDGALVQRMAAYLNESGLPPRLAPDVVQNFFGETAGGLANWRWWE